MYLKSVEMNGFKSFANRTKLDFEPGIIAIVGPNGCGKSNIVDAVRWAIGEQSVKALRSGKMEECIFNGTETHKAMGMAEVNLTFADCDKVLGVDYNEVMVTRRVFPTGEGHYFMNKVPCRLKDIQRLFMDTGIGAASYSIMAQGKIDQVLSAHPEDRRAIFEEASSITKFKADRDEAIRKLERTEANLLRLSDVIREVKRQIISLQRQAGKARRYKELRRQLQDLDIYTTRGKIRLMDCDIATLESKLKDTDKTIGAASKEVAEMERGNTTLRRSLLDTESEIGVMMQTTAQAEAGIERAQDLIRLDKERIHELESLYERDASDIKKAQAEIEASRESIKNIESGRRNTAQNLEKAQQGHDAKASFISQHEQKIKAVRHRIEELRAASLEAEDSYAKQQNQLVEAESRSRSDITRRERLTAEQTQLSQILHSYEERLNRMVKEIQEAQEKATRQEKTVAELSTRRSEVSGQIERSDQLLIQTFLELKAKEAQLDLLSNKDRSVDLPRGTQLLLDESNPLGIPHESAAGPLLSHIRAEQGYQTALEAAIHSWLHAVVVSSPETALNILRLFEAGKEGSAQMLAVTGAHDYRPVPEIAGHGEPLLDHVKPSEETAPLIHRLLANVVVVDTLDAIPSSVPPDLIYVTKTGIVVRGDTAFEFWPESEQPFNQARLEQVVARHKKEMSEIQEKRTSCEQSLAGLRSTAAALDVEIRDNSLKLDEYKNNFFLKKGESHIVEQEVKKAGERLEVVAWELRSMDDQSSAYDDLTRAIASKMEAAAEQRSKAKAELDSKEQELEMSEKDRAGLAAELMEHRLRVSELTQKTEHLDAQSAPLKAHLAQLESLIAGRSEGLTSYRANIGNLNEAIRNADGQARSLTESIAGNKARLESLRRNKEKQARELEEMENALEKNRTALDEIRNEQSRIQVVGAESRMRRQNLIDRTVSEYHVTLQNIMEGPEPAWTEGKPDGETLETMIAELRTKLEAMGAVNLVADEEFEELQKRHEFLTQQQDDLAKAKRQLLDMINKINATTAEMFTTTFAAINENFQTMFRKFFGGGSAKLVLTNEEDVLECGIEIIARPPGKRLQNISLLSGGERTLTAVALLFAIYMFKPSPFCMLDEIDAALDDANIGRFADVLKEFVKQSQFVLITHNRQSIAAADVLYGITMEEKGISKVVSMRFKDNASLGTASESFVDSTIAAPAVTL